MMELLDVEGLDSDTGDESISIGSDEDSTEPFTLSTAASGLAVGSACMTPVREKPQSWVLFGLKPSLRPPCPAMEENGSPRPSPLLDGFCWSFLNAWKRLTSRGAIHSLPKTPSMEGWHWTKLTWRRQVSQVSWNSLLLLLAYKPDLEDDMSISPSPEV